MYKVSVIKIETKLYHNYMILKLCKHKYKRSITSKTKKNFLIPQSFSYQFNESQSQTENKLSTLLYFNNFHHTFNGDGNSINVYFWMNT